jgi:hypothetical protein
MALNPPIKSIRQAIVLPVRGLSPISNDTR